ncbi:MAG: lipid-binding SYLF domain-containing protein [Campylobacteraceae bacterium]|nr:lipid-binding SYLF domain-containing protein [Campylobacteraceae bacterium]
MRKLLIFLFAFCISANADVTQNQQVYAAANVLKSFGCDANKSISVDELRHAKAIAVLTDVTKTSFIASVQKGNGVFSMRDFDGNWTPPLMVKYRSFGAGPQAGIESKDMILIFHTSKSFRDIFEGADLLGLNAGATVGEGGAAGVTTDLPEMSAWIVNPGESTGVYFGVSLDFGRLMIDDQATNDYYERIYDYEDILNGSPKDSQYTKLLKKALNTYILNDGSDYQCNIDKFVIEN